MSAALALRTAEAIHESRSYQNQSPEDDMLAAQLINDWQYLFGLRGNWASHWTEIAMRILPRESWYFQNYAQLNMQGDKRNFELYDSTGLLALQKFSAIMDSLLTPRDQFWHHIKPSDPRLLKDKSTRLWYERANNVLFEKRYAPESNFSAQNQGQYTSLGAYGTGINFIDKLAGRKAGLRYKNVHLGQLYLQENHQNLVDRVCRHFMMTARQAYLMFGEECPDNIKSVMRQFPERQFFFLHWVRPNNEMDPDRKDYAGMPISSIYVSIEGRKLMGRSGYLTFPYAISRYYQTPDEPYGRSIAMDVLPSLKTLNEQKKTMLKQGHRAVDPVILGHDDGVLDGFDLTPGALNAGGVTADGKLLINTLPVGNVQAGKELMEDERNLINESFLATLFQILVDGPAKTATEVLELVREKGILLAPTVGRQQSEYLGPMIDRELDLLSQQGLLPPQTPLMREAKDDYKTEYDSPISRTMKAEWAAGAQRTISVLQEVATATGDPSYLFYINMDKAAPQIAAINGTPASWIRDDKEVQKLKAQHAKNVQLQQLGQMAPAIAGALKAGGAGGGAPGGMGAPAPAPSVGAR